MTQPCFGNLVFLISACLHVKKKNLAYNIVTTNSEDFPMTKRKKQITENHGFILLIFSNIVTRNALRNGSNNKKSFICDFCSSKISVLDILKAINFIQEAEWVNKPIVNTPIHLLVLLLAVCVESFPIVLHLWITFKPRALKEKWIPMNGSENLNVRLE